MVLQSGVIMNKFEFCFLIAKMYSELEYIFTSLRDISSSRKFKIPFCQTLSSSPCDIMM